MKEKNEIVEEIKGDGEKETADNAKSGASLVDKFSGYIAAFLVGAGIAGGVCWYTMSYTQRDIISVGKDFIVTKECHDVLEQNGGVADGKPVRSAIEAYVKSISKDSYTYYYEEDDLEEMVMYVNSSGTAKLSGFKIAPANDGNILLAEVTEGMPAYKQGLRTNDEITAINGASVSEAGFENIANKMLGKDGTQVAFTVLREDETFDIDFIRSSEMTSSVEFKDMGDIAYIHLTIFDQIAQGQLNQALDKAKGKKKMIIDLRNNGGGDTIAGINMAAMICGHAKCVSTNFDGTQQIIEQNYNDVENDREIVVLINDGTASCAEIFTAIMKKNAGAILVGTNTYGKGVFQREVTLSNGAILHYTAGSFEVEGWDNWDGVGIAPDVEVPMDKELIGTDNDIQLKKAIALLE